MEELNKKEETLWSQDGASWETHDSLEEETIFWKHVQNSGRQESHTGSTYSIHQMYAIRLLDGTECWYPVECHIGTSKFWMKKNWTLIFDNTNETYCKNLPFFLPNKKIQTLKITQNKWLNINWIPLSLKIPSKFYF